MRAGDGARDGGQKRGKEGIERGGRKKKKIAPLVER